jgi:hypothetical protein
MMFHCDYHEATRNVTFNISNHWMYDCNTNSTMESSQFKWRHIFSLNHFSIFTPLLWYNWWNSQLQKACLQHDHIIHISALYRSISRSQWWRFFTISLQSFKWWNTSLTLRLTSSVCAFVFSKHPPKIRHKSPIQNDELAYERHFKKKSKTITLRVLPIYPYVSFPYGDQCNIQIWKTYHNIYIATFYCLYALYFALDQSKCQHWYW